ncbi:SNF-12 protein [Aphelenchoides avenae]|nr:SNF-12 protein [Aphelenchus avenae]
MGVIQDHLIVALAIAWIIVFFGVFKGIGSIGWAVTITATIPYLLLVILLMRGMSLKGAWVGLSFFFKPDFTKLWSMNMWKSAAEQVFYSLGIDAGPLISMASFSRYRNNIYRDAVMLVVLDTLTSILCGMVIFSFIGFLATEQGKELTDVLKHDSWYLAFTVYPGVTSFMEWGFLWAALFFAMLTLSALDAEFAWLEMIASSIMNQFGSKEKRLENRLLVALCLFCFICGIPLCAQGGIYIFHSIENLNANWNSFSLSLVQVVIVCYVYVRFELLFEKVSDAKIVVEGTGNVPIERLRDLAAGTGAVKADLRMVATTKFTNFNHSASGTPRYLGWASDGDFKVELEMPFSPPFSAGDEFRVRNVTGRKSGGKVYLFIAKPSDVEKVTEDKKIPRQLKNLKFFECDA